MRTQTQSGQSQTGLNVGPDLGYGTGAWRFGIGLLKGNKGTRVFLHLLKKEGLSIQNKVSEDTTEEDGQQTRGIESVKLGNRRFNIEALLLPPLGKTNSGRPLDVWQALLDLADDPDQRLVYTSPGFKTRYKDMVITNLKGDIPEGHANAIKVSLTLTEWFHSKIGGEETGSPTDSDREAQENGEKPGENGTARDTLPPDTRHPAMIPSDARLTITPAERRRQQRHAQYVRAMERSFAPIRSVLSTVLAGGDPLHKGVLWKGATEELADELQVEIEDLDSAFEPPSTDTRGTPPNEDIDQAKQLTRDAVKRAIQAENAERRANGEPLLPDPSDGVPFKPPAEQLKGPIRSEIPELSRDAAAEVMRRLRNNESPRVPQAPESLKELLSAPPVSKTGVKYLDIRKD